VVGGEWRGVSWTFSRGDDKGVGVLGLMHRAWVAVDSRS
jgi:hypothetical protein